MSGNCSQREAQEFSKPLTVWLKAEHGNFSQIKMAPMGFSQNSDESWSIPPLNLFTIHNREVHLNIDGFNELSEQAVLKIRTIFGSNVSVSALSLQNTTVTREVMELIRFFNVKKLFMEKFAEEPFDVPHLGEITFLMINECINSENLAAIENSLQLVEIHLNLELNEQNKLFLQEIIQQWQAGKRNVEKWVIQVPIQWKLSSEDYKNDNGWGKYVLKLRVEDCSLVSKKAVFTVHQATF